MTTECNQEPFPFHPLNQREIRGQFDGGSITSDAGGLLLREVEKRTNIIGQFASCFSDYRDPELVEHGVAELLAQRIYGLALGYEDLNDHEELRRDPLLAVLVEKEDLTGEQRRLVRDQGTALAGKSTLNRMELGARTWGKRSGTRRSSWTKRRWIGRWWISFLQAHDEAPKEIVLDLDSTDIPLHGQQEERFFHGYYGHYCYLPLYIVCGEFVLCARLRPSNIDGAKGSVAEVERIVGQRFVKAAENGRRASRRSYNVGISRLESTRLIKCSASGKGHVEIRQRCPPIGESVRGRCRYRNNADSARKNSAGVAMRTDVR
jgi:Transposase DDE domain group 1